MVHENWRFRPWYRRLRAWLDAGELGELLSFELAMLSSGLLPRRHRPPAGARAAALHGPRAAADAGRGADPPPRRGAASCAARCGVVARPRRADAAGGGRRDARHRLPGDGSGAPVVVGGTMAAPGHPARTQDRLEIVGSRASARSTARRAAPARTGPARGALRPDRSYQESFDATIRHFVDCARERRAVRDRRGSTISRRCAWSSTPTGAAGATRPVQQAEGGHERRGSR